MPGIQHSGVGGPFLSFYQAPPCFFLANKIHTLAADDVHFEVWMVVPGLHVEPEEPGRDGMLQVGDLHCVTVRVAAQQLQREKNFAKKLFNLYFIIPPKLSGLSGLTFLSP